jgi:hypothetical protein
MENQENKPESGQGSSSQEAGSSQPDTQSTQNTQNQVNTDNNNSNVVNTNDATVSIDNQVNTEKQPETTPNTPNTEEKKENTNFDSYAPDFDKNSASSGNSGSDEEKSSKTGTIITTVLIVVIAFGIWQANSGDDQPKVAGNDNNIEITVDDSNQEGDVTIVSDTTKDDGQMVAGDMVKIIAYYPKSDSASCDQVFPLEREVPKKYDSDVLNTARGLLISLTGPESEDGWVTSVPAGTYLKNIAIKDGHAVIKLSSALDNIAGSCMVENARLQITQTLTQFAYINSVDICVEDNCNDDEILQP